MISHRINWVVVVSTNLERVEIQVPIDLVDIQQDLCGVPDPGDGAMAVPAAG